MKRLLALPLLVLALDAAALTAPEQQQFADGQQAAHRHGERREQAGAERGRAGYRPGEGAPGGSGRGAERAEKQGGHRGSGPRFRGGELLPAGGARG